MDAASGGDERMVFVRGLARSQRSPCDGRDAAIAIANPGDAFVVAGAQPDVAAVADAAAPRVHRASRRVRADRVAHAPAGGGGAAVSRVARRGERAPAAARHARVCRDRWRVGARCRRGARQAGAADRGAGRMGGVPGRLCRGRRGAFVELGPGRALAEMAAAAYPALPARSVADFRSVDGVESWLARVAGD
jgi:[acyl-carrier-protein] S-malonyltransferase